MTETPYEPGTHVHHRNGQTGTVLGPHGGDHTGPEPVFTCKDTNCYLVRLDGSTVTTPWHHDDIVPSAEPEPEPEPEEPLSSPHVVMLRQLGQARCPQLATTHIRGMIDTAAEVARLAHQPIRTSAPSVAQLLGAINKLRHAADELEAELLEKLLGVSQA